MNSIDSTEALPKVESAVRLGRFELDPRRGTLCADGCEIPLRPKTFALLMQLAASPGKLVSKERLMQAIWPGVVVGDDSLTQCVGELRAALGEPGLVKTVPRRGYRLELPPTADAQSLGSALIAPTAPMAPTAPTAFAASTAPTAPSVPTAFTASIRQRAWRAGAFGVAAAVLLATGLVAWRGTALPLRLDAAIAAQRAIAILPFNDLGELRGLGGLGEGRPSAYAAAVTEDVLISVARLPDVLVFAAGNTVPPGAPAGIPAALRGLGATHYLNGSVERRGDTTLIRTELHRVADGAMLWSERFEYPGDAPWTWQRDATQRIAQSLDVRLRDTPPLPTGTRPHAPAAAVQLGMQLVIQARNRDDVLRARSLLQSALATDPDSVVALTFLGFTHTQQVMRGWSTDSQGDTLAASSAIDRAIALQPNYWPAHFHRSFVMYLRGDIDAAARECEAVLALWPNEPHALQRLGFYRLMQGRSDEVAALVNLALRLNPLEPTQVASGHFYLGMALFHQQRDADAYDELRQAAAANPALGLPRLWMASIDALHGRDTDAQVNLEAVVNALPDLTISMLQSREATRSSTYTNGQLRFYEGIRRAGLPA